MKMQRTVPGIAAVAAAAVAAFAAYGAVQKVRDNAATGGLTLDLDGESVRVAARQGAGATPVGGLKRGQGSPEDDSKIAMVTARLLASNHYARQPINDSTSAQLFDAYLDTLDPQRLFFLDGDVAEFAADRDKLDDQITGSGDTSFAQKVFARYLQRYQQQTDFALAALKDPKNFDYSADQSFAVDRKQAARPKSTEEARALWTQRLRYEYLQLKMAGDKPAEITNKLSKRYNGGLRAVKEWDSDDVFELYLTTLTHVYDPHSDYFGRASAENFSIGMKLSLYGIGARLKSEDGYTVIEDITPGSPAQKSKKLRPGDKIVAVAQGRDGEAMDVVDMKLTKVVEQIRGPKGSVVRLTIQPADAPDASRREVVSIVRDEIKLEEQAANARLMLTPAVAGGKPTRIGVIDLPLFYSDPEKGKSATEDVAVLLRKLKAEGVDGVILDLRKNGGGSLPEAVSLTGLFIKSGPVVQVRDPSGAEGEPGVKVMDDNDRGVAYDGPLVVLTSRFSASASEIVAGALQDHGRALVVGDRSTFGKGTVQALVNLGPIMERMRVPTEADPGQIKLTIQKFYRPSGASTQLKGVEADVTLPSLNAALNVGESELERPLPYDTIAPVDFTKMNRVTPYLAELKARSQARVAADPDFVFLRGQIARLQKAGKEKTVSLNEAKRLQEKKELEAVLDARDKQLAARTAPADKVYILTLKDAAKPGLPAALTPAQLKAGVTASTDDDDTAADEATGAADTKSKKRTREPDADLNEARRILSDYIALSRKSGTPWSAPLAANQPK